MSVLRYSFGIGMIQQQRGEIFEYGVWWAGFTYHRLPVLIAVDAFGDIRKWRAVKPIEDGEALGDRLWAWLLKYHPERKLELVNEAPRSPVPAEPIRLVSWNGRMVDARLLEDPRSPLAAQRHRQNLAKAAGQHRSMFASRPRP